MNKTYGDIKTLLVQSGTEPNEAKAIALLLMEKVCGMSTTDVLRGDGGTTCTPQEQQALDMAALVAQGMPVQYVLGEADFCGMTFRVAPGVLIPRPETEELVAWVVEQLGVRSQEPLARRSQLGVKILDVGTGSGCIAVALAKQLAGAEVEAWDISEEALKIAVGNAERQGVSVNFQHVDVLKPQTSNLIPQTSYDCIVSNPPYICKEEAEEMERHVLEHEPSLALFVPNDDPLLFYRRIGELGLQLLKAEGMLFFEINRRFGKETVELLQGMGYIGVELRQDVYGNDRMVKAIKP